MPADYFSRHPQWKEGEGDELLFSRNPKFLQECPVSQEDLPVNLELREQEMPEDWAARAKDQSVFAFFNFPGAVGEDGETVSADHTWSPQTIKELQAEDPVIREVMEELRAKRELKGDKWKNWNRAWKEVGSNFYFGHDGVLYLQSKKSVKLLVVPSSLREFLLSSVHDSLLAGHQKDERMLARLQQRYFWPGMATDAKDWARSCEVCMQHAQPRHKDRGKLQSLRAFEPFALTAMDLVGPLPVSRSGNRYILVFIDYATRWVETEALPNKEAATIANAFNEMVLTRWGAPLHVLTDRGSEFLNEVLNLAMAAAGVRRFHTSPYHPETNGLVERTNNTIVRMLAPYVCAQQSDWDEVLMYATFAYRTNRHATTKVSPFKAMFGHEARIPEDHVMGPLNVVDEQIRRENRELAGVLARHHLDHALQIREERVNADRLADPFKEGQLVRRRVFAARRTAHVGEGGEVPLTAKLAKKWQGPFVIKEKRGHQLVLARPWRSSMIRLANINDVEPWFTAQRFKAAVDYTALSAGGDADDGDVDEEEEYVLADILNHRESELGREYLVSWEGFEDVRYNLWIPRINFGADNDKLFNYEASLIRGNVASVDPEVVRLNRARDLREVASVDVPTRPQEEAREADEQVPEAEVAAGREPANKRRRQKKVVAGSDRKTRGVYVRFNSDHSMRK